MKGGRFLLPALFKTLLLPPLIAALFIHHFPSLFPTFTALIYLISFPALYVFRSYASLVASSWKASALGAIDIPRVNGTWPLNIDILLNWAKSGTEEEVGRMMVLMGRQYGGTYNTRVLGEDQVCLVVIVNNQWSLTESTTHGQIISSDPKVIKHVLIDDFDNFVKGQKFKERAQDFLGDGIFNSDGDNWKFVSPLFRGTADTSPPQSIVHSCVHFSSQSIFHHFISQPMYKISSLNYHHTEKRLTCKPALGS